MSTIDQVRRALAQARDMLARETDPERRAILQVQVTHLQFKLDRALQGAYDTIKLGQT